MHYTRLMMKFLLTKQNPARSMRTSMHHTSPLCTARTSSPLMVPGAQTGSYQLAKSMGQNGAASTLRSWRLLETVGTELTN